MGFLRRPLPFHSQKVYVERFHSLIPGQDLRNTRLMRTILNDEVWDIGTGRQLFNAKEENKAFPSHLSSSSGRSPTCDRRLRLPKEYERPKAQKPVSFAHVAARPREMGELEVVAATFMLFLARILDPFVNPAPVQNFSLLICDIALLISFRTVEDMVLTPFPSINAAASSDLLKNGLIAYADPISAASHIFFVISDGLTLGCFWLAAILLGRAQAVEHDVGSSYALSTWATVRTWLSLVNIRLGVLFLHVSVEVSFTALDHQDALSWKLIPSTHARMHAVFCSTNPYLQSSFIGVFFFNFLPQALWIQEGVDLQRFQSEMNALLLTMLGWRWFSVSMSKALF